MRFLPVLQVEVTDTVAELISICYKQALKFQGQWVDKTISYGQYTAIIQVKDQTAYCIISGGVRGFATHPRNGLVKQFGYPTTIGSKALSYERGHMGIGYKVDGSTLVDLGDTQDNTSGQPFPVLNSDKYGCIFSNDYDDTSAWEFTGIEEIFYGNIDWKGPKADDAERRILTYYGNPSRYWPVDYYINIPDLSHVDHVVESDLGDSYAYMTVFAPYVFERGEVIAEMPWLYHPLNMSEGSYEANHQNAQVLGAAIRESDGALVCIVKTCYNSYPAVKPAPPAEGSMVSTWQVWNNSILVKDWYGDKTGAEQFCDANAGHTLVEVPDPGRGYWIEVLLKKSGNVEGGWTRLLRESTGSVWANCNFFFSEDGTKATSVQLGKVWKIDIAPNDTATCVTTDVGIFKNTISVTKTNTSESVPWSEDGITIIAKAGDYKDHGKEVREYSAIKSGEMVIASDYKGNEYKELKAAISGGDMFKKTQIISKYWGETAFVPSTEDVNRRTFSGINPAVWISLEGFPQGGGQLGSLSGACKPTCSVALTNMSLYSSGEGVSQCNNIYSINSSCVQTGKAEACIEVTVTAANGTAYRKDCILMSGFGTWEGESISSNWYWDEEPIGATKIRHYVFEWVNRGYDMCSNGRCAEEAALIGGTILSCNPAGYCYYEKQVLFTYICN